MNQRKQHIGRKARGGAVIIEFALCAPILFFFFFAAFEFARANMIRQSVENACYEGSRRGIVPGATVDDCKSSARAVLNSISATVATINVTPNPITSNTEAVTVQITVPLDSNSWVAPFFFANKSIVGSMTMRRERFSTSSVP
jgi:Flp pilus assembly protein TadG